MTTWQTSGQRPGPHRPREVISRMGRAPADHSMARPPGHVVSESLDSLVGLALPPNSWFTAAPWAVDTCADGRSSTPFPSRGTSAPTVVAAAATAAVPPGSTSSCTSAAMKSSARSTRLKNSRAVATRYDKRAYVFHGTVTRHGTTATGCEIRLKTMVLPRIFPMLVQTLAPSSKRARAKVQGMVPAAPIQHDPRPVVRQRPGLDVTSAVFAAEFDRPSSRSYRSSASSKGVRGRADLPCAAQLHKKARLI